MALKNAVDEEEMNQAVAEAEASDSIVEIELKKPVVYNGKSYEKLTFDFDSLTGKDGLDIENELAALGKVAVVPAFSGEYLIRMAAKACTDPIGSDIFEMISLHDYNRIRSAARSFLLRSE